jgi:hypothetical protein
VNCLSRRDRVAREGWSPSSHRSSVEKPSKDGWHLFRLTGERNAALAELSELTAPLDGLTGEASAWARRFLSQPAEVWRELPGAGRAAFAGRVFADGLTLADGEFQTPANSLLRLPFAPDQAVESAEGARGDENGVSNPAKPLSLLRLSPVSEAEEGMVRPTGFEPVLSP